MIFDPCLFPMWCDVMEFCTLSISIQYSYNNKSPYSYLYLYLIYIDIFVCHNVLETWYVHIRFVSYVVYIRVLDNGNNALTWNGIRKGKKSSNVGWSEFVTSNMDSYLYVWWLCMAWQCTCVILHPGKIYFLLEFKYATWS